jgi:outer membrane protein TolC
MRSTLSCLRYGVLATACVLSMAAAAAATEEPAEADAATLPSEEAPAFELAPLRPEVAPAQPEIAPSDVAQTDGAEAEVGQSEGAPGEPDLLRGRPPATENVDRSVLAEAPDVESILSLQNALLLALQNNLEIELARGDPALARESVREAEGAFDIFGTAGYGFEHIEQPVANTFQPGGAISADGWSYQAGVRKLLPFGLQFSSGYNLDRDESDAAQSTLERQFLGRWRTQLTVPLMRNFMLNDASVAVSRSEIARNMSEDTFAESLTDLISTVEVQYWEVAATRAGVNVARKSLQTARDLLEQTRVQLEVGVVSRVAVTQAEAGVAERELNLIRAENSAAAAQDTLLNALLAPSNDVLEEREIVPQTPSFTPYPVQLENAVQTAMARRPDLARARRALDEAELMTDLAQNQARPQLDLVASYDAAGLSGASKLRGDTSSGQIALANALADPDTTPEQIQAIIDSNNQPAAPRTVIGSSTDTFRGFLSNGPHSYTVGAQLEVPFGNRTGKARVEKREIESRRARTQLRRAEQQVLLEVRNAVRNLDSSAKAVRAADRRRVAVEESLRAEQERLRLGDSTPFQVLEFDEDLAEAELQLIDSLRAYENAITAFEQVQGTLLEKRGIVVQDALDR